MANEVYVDTTALERAMRTLPNDLDRNGTRAAQSSAQSCARQITSNVPRRTGRLASSVRVAPVAGGFAVSYGEGVPYARRIEHRTNTVADAVDDAREPFYAAALVAAQDAARRI